MKTYIADLYEEGADYPADCVPFFFSTREEAEAEAPRWLFDSGLPEAMPWAVRWTIRECDDYDELLDCCDISITKEEAERRARENRQADAALARMDHLFGEGWLDEPMIKLCKDCRHVNHEEKKCLHPEVGMWATDNYDGSKHWISPSIAVARTIGACGEDGKLWEHI